MEEGEYRNPLLEDIQTGAMGSQASQMQNESTRQQYVIEEKEKSLAEAQLECQETLKRQYHKLRQDTLIFEDNKKPFWKPCPPEERVLTDEGVDKIIQVLEGYVNKETLLSNFDRDQIRTRMWKFCNALNANLYMKYEIYFRTPSIKECETILTEQIQEKVNMKMMSLRLLGEEPKEEDARKEVLSTYGSSFDDEIQLIRENKQDENIREYELLFTQMEALVDAIHNRAFRGEERGSIRRHQNIQQVIGTSPSNVPQQKNNWARWGGGR